MLLYLLGGFFMGHGSAGSHLLIAGPLTGKAVRAATCGRYRWARPSRGTHAAAASGVCLQAYGSQPVLHQRQKLNAPRANNFIFNCKRKPVHLKNDM